MTEEDYAYFLGLADEDNTGKDWNIVLDENGVQVAKRPDPKAPINLVQIVAQMPGLDPAVCYRMLNDHDYRRTWDEHMIDGFIIEMLDDSNEIGYYAASVPSPLSNRDFVTHRTWRADDDKKEYIIFNKSVEHPKLPDKKGFVRGHSYTTGYLVRGTDEGCVFRYVTQSDPKGWIPKWLTNMVTSKVAPGVVDKVKAAVAGYPDFVKSKEAEGLELIHGHWLPPGSPVKTGV